MTFADLAAGDSVFLDANTFIYHFGRESRRGGASARRAMQVTAQIR
jgi:hypothetical protein